MLPLLIAILILFGIWYYSVASSKKWYEKWPAIDDDEFMLRCEPGTDREIALKVRRIVSEQLGIEYEHIYPEQNFVNDLGCD